MTKMTKDEWLVSFIIAPWGFIFMLGLAESPYVNAIDNVMARLFVLMLGLTLIMAALAEITRRVLLRAGYIRAT